MRRDVAKPFFLILAVVGSGAGWRLLWIVTASAEQLVSLMPDDAFYYFQVARNLAAGNGSTFDGLGVTNGYHPLWLLAVWPLAGGQTGLASVKAALILAVALSVAAAMLVYGILRLTTHTDWIAASGAGIYGFALTYWTSSLNGLETSLTTCLFLLAIWYLLKAADLSGYRWIVMGLCLGALFLARTDTAFYIVALAGTAVLRSWQKRQTGPIVGLLGVIALVISPWLVWSWITFGSPVQTSGQAVPYVLHENFRQAGHVDSEQFALSWRYFSTALSSGYVWLIGAGLVVMAARKRYLRSPEARLFVALASGLWLGGCGLVFVHAFIRWYPRPWYFDQLNALALLVVCNLVALAGQTSVAAQLKLRLQPHRATMRWAVRLTVVALFMGLTASTFARNLHWLAEGEYPHQLELLDAARWVTENVPPNEAVAAFNAGILAYFSERRVINLDGAISNSAYRALEAKCLLCFMRTAGVAYFVDYDPLMRQDYDSFFGPVAIDWQLVATFDRPAFDFGQSVVRVYRLRWGSG